MREYLDLLREVLDRGTEKSDRTGTGTKSVFGRQIRFDLQFGFPLVTTKRVFWKGVVAELLWFISGDTNAKTLQAQGVKIWDEWAKSNGDLGPVYGKQWREWSVISCGDGGPYDEPIDQLKNVLQELRTNPDSRRLIVSAWNVADLPAMALAPCHCLFQFNTRPLRYGKRYTLAIARFGAEGLRERGWYGQDQAGKEAMLNEWGIPTRALDLQLYQRSADIFLGVPFNIASYALLLILVARDVGMEPGEFVHTFGDLHLYSNHLYQAEHQLQREPQKLPTVSFTEDAPTDLFAIRPEHIVLSGYDPHPAIPAPVAV